MTMSCTIDVKEGSYVLVNDITGDFLYANINKDVYGIGGNNGRADCEAWTKFIPKIHMSSTKMVKQHYLLEAIVSALQEWDLG